MNMLITGFEPFMQDRSNPSWEIAKALDGWQLGNTVVRAIQLPVIFDDVAIQLQQALKKWQPECVICLGVAANRNTISLERIAINIDDAQKRIAINIDDAQIADNAGNQPIYQPIDAQGVAAFFSTLPIKAIFRKLQQENIAVEVFNTAGTYVCNHLFYHLMSIIQHTQVKGGFIHVPADQLLDTEISIIWIMDKAYNSEERVTHVIHGVNGQVVMPTKSNALTQREYDMHLYKSRHLIENFFAKLKQYRAIATRYDKLALNFLSAIYLAASVICLN